MRNRHLVWVWLVVFGALCSAAQGGGEKPSSGEAFVGTWTGTWEGAGASGGFNLTLEKDTAGTLTGKVSVTGEPTYTAAFKTLSFDGKKMTAKYDFPPDERGEVVLAASFEGGTATGTWTVREKGSDNEVLAGTWAVAKK